MVQQQPVIHDLTATSVATRPNGGAERIAQLRQLKNAAKLREERMKRIIVLPDATADLRELTGDDTIEFRVTIKRGSQADVALLPDCPPAAREYVEIYLESLNSAMFEWLRGNPDVEVDKLTDAEKKKQNIDVGSHAQEKVIREFGGVENEKKRRALADAFCLALVVDPDIVPTDEDVEDETTQISLESLSASDRIFIQQECQKMEDDAVATELKSVPAGDVDAIDAETVADGPIALPEADPDSAPIGNAADSPVDADWIHAG